MRRLQRRKTILGSKYILLNKKRLTNIKMNNLDLTEIPDKSTAKKETKHRNMQRILGYNDALLRQVERPASREVTDNLNSRLDYLR